MLLPKVHVGGVPPLIPVNIGKHGFAPGRALATPQAYSLHASRDEPSPV